MSDSDVRDDIEREHCGLPPSSPAPVRQGVSCFYCGSKDHHRDNCPKHAQVVAAHELPRLWSRASSGAESSAARVVFSFEGDQTEHQAHPACSTSGPHPISECGLWKPGR